MVVLAASICTRGGKAIISRQFKGLSKDRVTALLATFPSLLSESNAAQHTTVENETVRYVYQPLEELYIVLITNKHSNILQDIDTLHLFAQTITSLLRSVHEREIYENAFEILSAFDEIVILGYKEIITPSQVRTYLEMDSHEEKIQEIIERNKELEATEERKRRAKEIQRKENFLRENRPPSFSSHFSQHSHSQSQSQQSQHNVYTSNTTLDSSSNSLSYLSSKSKVAPRGKGLQLGKSKNPRRQSQQIDSLLPEQNPLLPLQNNSVSNQQHQFLSSLEKNTNNTITNNKTSYIDQTQIQPQDYENNGILIVVNEKISAQINRDGSIQSSEIKGDLQLRISNSDLSHSMIYVKVNGKNDGIQYKTHPNVDRNKFNKQNLITLKDSSKSFPSNDQSLNVLRWRGVGKADNDSFIPIIFTTWLTASNNNPGFFDVTIEYEVINNFNIEKFTINVPTFSDIVLRGESKNDSSLKFEFDEDIGALFEKTLSSPNGDSENDDQLTGTIEFSAEANEEDALFPMESKFVLENSNLTIGKIEVQDVLSIDNEEESLPYDVIGLISSDNFVVV
ncbi:coatomer subunit delta ASCRUDRAFT_75490 [Ascoidea rubescens DSM 1968]|uniref:Coatomer subunit delta n=1 Tax=Ascoidea rubescens DSM 1968 TaxID=1344418 RepID=A0A1D2VIM3_9ASCO|nr:hypothetical protein ASCRUDRAFT_75490 [Ascoidea rubescens DSM 1968]ODV61485.1 hypothetical protein ASCRUDRAFT_75490 [Ascoidea rubescens DSM 1968]